MGNTFWVVVIYNRQRQESKKNLIKKFSNYLAVFFLCVLLAVYDSQGFLKGATTVNNKKSFENEKLFFFIPCFVCSLLNTSISSFTADSPMKTEGEKFRCENFRIYKYL